MIGVIPEGFRELEEEEDPQIPAGFSPVEDIAPGPTPLSSRLVDFVKEQEGYYPKAYSDYAQHSVGWGTRAKSPDEEITEEEAERRLQEELASHYDRVAKSAEKVGAQFTPNQLDALASFDYNTGKGSYLVESSKGDIGNIRERLPQYRLAGGKVLPGLEKRRAGELAMFDQAIASGPKFADTGSDSAKRAVIEQREAPIPEGFRLLEEDRIDVPELDNRTPGELRNKLYPGEDKYFKEHPEVAGMAAEDDKVILNPYSPGDVNKDAVIKNEGFRIKMRQSGVTPDFKVTEEQKAAFKGTEYEKDENALKQTIAARIYSGDPSAKATAEQKAWVQAYGSDQPAIPEGFREMPDDQPALQAKQSPSELVEHVGTAIEAGKSVWESAKRGVMSSGLGLGETINRYAYSPIVHGLREAIDYIAPGSDLAKHAATFDDAFYENTVAKPAAQRAQLGKESAETGVVGEVAHSVGQLAGDLPQILLTSGVLPELKGGMELVNALRHGAASMTLPAMRAGADEAEAVKAKGGSEIEQLGAFIKATTISMGMGAVPMATSSSAPSMMGRFAERTAKAVPIGSATVEAGRMADNALSSLTGGEQKPFSLKENIMGTIPMALLGGVMGRNTSAKSRVIRDIQTTAESAGVKVTPEQVEAFVGKPKPTPEEFSSFVKKAYAEARGEEPPFEPAPTLGAVANPKAVKGVEMAKTEAKRSADFVRGLPKWNDYIKNILTWSADNAKDKHNTRELQKSMMKDIPENVRNAIPNWIQANGDATELQRRASLTKNATLKKGYEDAAKFGPEEVAIARQIQQRYDDFYARAKDEQIDIKYLQNYVTQMWKNPDLAGTGFTRGLSSYFKYAKQRSFPDFFTGEQAGEVPKTKDIARLLPIYENALNDAINAKRLAKSLQTGKAEDGRPLVAPIRIMGNEKGMGYKVLENHPAFAGKVVHPEIYHKLSKALGSSKLREWWNSPSDNPFTEYGKGISRFLLDEVQGHMKATTFSLSPFHQVHLGKHSAAHLVNPLKHLLTKGVDPNDPQTAYAMKHGLMVAPDTVSQHHFLEGVGAGQKNLVTKALRKTGMDKGADVIDGYTSYLFERFIPALKMDTFSKVLARNQKRFAKELESGKVSLDQVASRTADEVNASYGHLNYVKMGRSPTVQHWLQIGLLAPDFFEARIRYAAQGMQGLAGSKATEQMMSLAGMAVALYVLARVANTMDHGDAEWDPEHAFKFVRGNKSWGIRSVPGDLHDLIFKGVGRFIANRVSPLAGRGTLNILTGENWRGEKTDFGKTITEMISNTVPMPLQGYTQKFTEQERAQSITPMEKFMQSWGFQVSRHSPISVTHNLAREWMKTNDPARYKKLENSDFPESKYRALRYALEDSDEEGAREQAEKLGPDIGKGFQQSVLNPFTGSNASDQKFYDSLSEHDKLLFEAAIKRRALILERYREWVGPLGTKTDVTEAGLYRRMREAKMKKVVLPDEQP